MGYSFPDDPPDDELTPVELHDRIDEVTNLSADEQREIDHFMEDL